MNRRLLPFPVNWAVLGALRAAGSGTPVTGMDAISWWLYWSPFPDPNLKGTKHSLDFYNYLVALWTVGWAPGLAINSVMTSHLSLDLLYASVF